MQLRAARERRRSVFYKYFASYTLVLIVPLAILGAVLYRSTVVTVRTEREQLEGARIISLQQSMDGEIRELERVALRIAQDPNLSPYALTGSQYNAYLAAPLLATHASSSKLAPEVFLGFHRDDLLYSTGGTLRVSTLLEYVYQLSIPQHIEFLQATIAGGRPIALGPWPPTTPRDARPRLLTFVFPLPILERTQPALVMFAVRESTLCESIRFGAFDPAQVICIVGEEDRLLLWDGTVSAPPPETLATWLHSPRPGDDVILGGRRYSLAVRASKIGPLTYASFTPIDDMLAGVRRSRRSTLLLLSLVVSAGVILAMLLSRINYKPILELRQRIRRDIPRSMQDTSRNEFGEIRYGLDLALAERSTLAEKIRRQQPLVREQALSMILRGETELAGGVERLASLCGLDLRAPGFRALAIAFPALQRKRTTFRDIALTISRTVTAVLPDSTVETVEMVHDELAIIVSSRARPITSRDIESVAASLAGRLHGDLGLRVSIGVGKTRNTASELSNSYLEALSALEHAMLSGSTCSLFEEMDAGGQHRHWHPVEELARLTQALKQGNGAGYRSALADIFESMGEHELSTSMSRAVCYAIANTVVITINELHVAVADTDVEELVSFASLPALRSALLRMGQAICSLVRETMGNRHAELQQQIVAYVEEQFCDPLLSLEEVAGSFGFSLGHVGRLLRSGCGKGFAEMLRELRMNEAKRLLRETRRRVKHVVRDVGYGDVANFTRTFRVLEGVTPLQYRTIHRIRSRPGATPPIDPPGAGARRSGQHSAEDSL